MESLLWRLLRPIVEQARAEGAQEAIAAVQRALPTPNSNAPAVGSHGPWEIGLPCPTKRFSPSSPCRAPNCEPHTNGWGDTMHLHWVTECRVCDKPWPCPTIRALDAP